MTLEYLKEKKEKYQAKVDYFKKLECIMLASEFQDIVDLIESFIKEKCSD
jgi:hypothetical protein